MSAGLCQVQYKYLMTANLSFLRKQNRNKYLTLGGMMSLPKGIGTLFSAAQASNVFRAACTCPLDRLNLILSGNHCNVSVCI